MVIYQINIGFYIAELLEILVYRTTVLPRFYCSTFYLKDLKTFKEKLGS